MAQTDTITNLGTGGIAHQVALDKAAMATAITVIRTMDLHQLDRDAAAAEVAERTNTSLDIVLALLDRAWLIAQQTLAA